MDDDNGIVSIVDDEPSMRRALSNLIRSVGFDVRAFASAQEYLTTRRPNGPTCLVLDVQLPGLSGLDLQQELAKTDNATPIVFLTGHGDIPMTVRALKAGAVDFLTKPVDDQALFEAIRQGMTRSQHQRLAGRPQGPDTAEAQAQTLEHQVGSIRSALDDGSGFDAIIGRAPTLVAVLKYACKVAPTDTTVLLTGESGTGKEVLARAIHQTSSRAGGPFVGLNCAALPETLFESELFGHERGAFTGADRLKRGRFELAAGGTLFLDEIGELSAAMQVKLLRVLQEREYQRVGGTATLKADVRLVAATNRDLMAEMAAGRFRSDLFYRLSVFNVQLPPLRERGDDVLLLADYFIRTLAARMGKADVTLSRDAREVLRRHPWPGNIRELQNAIERGLITCEGTLVTAGHLEIHTLSEGTAPPPHAEPLRPAAGSGALQELERKAIIDALQRAHGHKSRAAALLGVTRFQLYNRLKRHHIEFPRDE
jgi:DNA-binding NtrC family response regulator